MNMLWYKEGCSKSEEVKKYLDEKNISYKLKEYLIDVPTESNIMELIFLLEDETIDLVRQDDSGLTEKSYKDLTDEDIVKLLMERPDVLQRPIYQTSDKAIIVRPAEKIKIII